MREVPIFGAVRSPIGKRGGAQAPPRPIMSGGGLGTGTLIERLS